LLAVRDVRGQLERGPEVEHETLERNRLERANQWSERASADAESMGTAPATSRTSHVQRETMRLRLLSRTPRVIGPSYLLVGCLAESFSGMARRTEVATPRSGTASQPGRVRSSGRSP
jgi:hypothetical protein